MPNSSAVDGEDEVGVASGRMRLTVPSPGPLPNQPPCTKLSMRGVDLEGVARRRVEEPVDARRPRAAAA